MRRRILFCALLIACSAPAGAQSGLDDGAAPAPAPAPDRVDPLTKPTVSNPAFTINAERRRRVLKVISAIINVIDGTPGDDDLLGTTDNDAIDAKAGDDTVDAWEGDDLVICGPGVDFVLGGAGCDVILGGPGTSILYGGPGDDCIEAGSDSGTMFGEEGDDVITGGRRIDVVSAGIGSDMVQAGEDCDVVTHDVFANRGYTDMYDGQQHLDELCLEVSSYWRDRIMNATSLEDDFAAADHEQWFDFSVYGPPLGIEFKLETLSFEVLTFCLVPPPSLFTIFGDNADFNTFADSQWDPATYYDALAGNDFVTLPDVGAGPSDYDESNPFLGGPGADRIFGGSRSDIIFGGGDGDQITGNGGDDILNGAGPGVATSGLQLDTVLFNDEDPCNYSYSYVDPDTIRVTDLSGNFGDEGTDIVSNFVKIDFRNSPAYDLHFAMTSDIVGDFTERDFALGFNDAATPTSITDSTAGIFVDRILSDDVFIGGDGPNTISGDVGTSMGAPSAQGITEGGDDLIKGGGGNDSLFGDAPDRFVNVAAGGWDTILGGPGNDVIVGDAREFDASNASGGNDELRGEDDDDIIIGDFEDIAPGSGALILGDDVVVGGPGNDTLYGDFVNDNTGGAIGNADGADRLIPGPGTDTCYGGIAQIGVGAIDIAEFPRPACEYGFSRAGGQSINVFDVVSGVSTVNQLIRVDAAQFNSRVYQIRIVGSASAPPGNGDPLVDELIVGDGANNVLAGDGVSASGASLSDDIVVGGGPAVGVDILYGDTSTDIVNGGTGGDDCIQGDDGDDSLYGDSGSLTDSSGGRDTIEGGGNDDSIWGDADTVTNSVCANDIIRGESGDDYIVGDAQFFDALSVAGEDFIDGGPGNDDLYGDEGPGTGLVFGACDTFVFAFQEGEFGSDTIFKLGDGGVMDAIQFWNVPRADPLMATLADLDTLVADGDAQISEIGGSTFITVDWRADGNGGNGLNSSVKLDGVTGLWVPGMNFTQLDAALRAANLASIEPR